MTINATFIGQIIVFLILLWFIAKFVTPPLAQAIGERQKKIAEGIAAAEKGKQDLAAAQLSAEAVVREARERAGQILEQANRRSTDLVESAKGTATAESERIIAAARAETTIEMTRARDALRREVGGLVVKSTSRLLQREVDAKTHAQLLDNLVTEIGRNGG
jgi:F-type H+-transporting ATPase subunit b